MGCNNFFPNTDADRVASHVHKAAITLLSCVSIPEGIMVRVVCLVAAAVIIVVRRRELVLKAHWKADG